MREKSIQRNTIAAGRSSRSTRPMGRIRRFLGMAVLLLFVYGFLGWGTASRTIASLLSRTQLGPVLLGILEGKGEGAFLVAILILGSTALFGRWYCAFLCPLGTAQQIVSPKRMAQGGRLFRYPTLDAGVRYGIVGIVAALLCGGIVAGWGINPVGLNLWDPYGLSGRILRDMIFPLLVFLNWLLFHVCRVFDLYVPLLSHKPDLPVFFATLLVGGSWIVLSRKRGRVYCGSFCPVGTILGICSRVSPYRIQIEPTNCARCGICSRVCPTGALIQGQDGVVHCDVERCVLCMNCIEACPHGALRYGGRDRLLAEIPAGPDPSTKPVPETSKIFPISPLASPVPLDSRAPLHSRREFLTKAIHLSSGLVAYFSLIALGGAVTYGLVPEQFLLRKRSQGPSGKPNFPSTPPGSLGIERFTSLCISCHLCVSHCPTGVLSPSLFEYGMKGLFQPVMDYKRGFCEYECTQCGEVCPTGAILPLTVEAKKTVQIGRVKFEEERCVVVTQGTICGACAEVCPTHAVGMIPYRNGTDIPAIDNALCVGCGSCEHACPVPRKAIFVEGLAVHGTAEVRKPLHTLPRELAKKEFPF